MNAVMATLQECQIRLRVRRKKLLFDLLQCALLSAGINHLNSHQSPLEYFPVGQVSQLQVLCYKAISVQPFIHYLSGAQEALEAAKMKPIHLRSSKVCAHIRKMPSVLLYKTYGRGKRFNVMMMVGLFFN